MRVSSSHETQTHAHQTLRKITLEIVSMKISDAPPPPFYHPLPFNGRNLNPNFFVKILKTQPLSPFKREGRGGSVPIMITV